MVVYPAGLVRDYMPAVTDDDMTRRQVMFDKLDNARSNLETAWANWDTLTATQKDTALKLTIRVVCALSRLATHSYETSGP